MRNKFTHILFVLAWSVVFFGPLRKIFSIALNNETYSHILAVPFISAYFFYTDRKTIFTEWQITKVRYFSGFTIIIIGLLSLGAARLYGASLSQNDRLSLIMFAAILTLLGYCLVTLKKLSIKPAIFPGLFLLLAVPIPDMVRESIIAFLITGSTAVTETMFRITGVPYFREGIIFQLPGITIEVAKECSGIRSSIGMLITVLIASHLFLKRFFTKALLVSTIVPFVLIKNGIRITTLTLLAVYVDKSYLTDSFLHKSGGVVFFAIALLLMFPILIYLRRLENKKEKGIKPGTTLFKKRMLT